MPKKDMYGICKLKYEGNAPGWWVRLHFVDGKPTVQQTFFNSEYGGWKKALKAAIQFRDNVREDFASKGINLVAKKPRPNKVTKTGVAGIRLNIQRRHSENISYVAWTVSWSEWEKGKKKPRFKQFGFNAHGGAWEAFAEAAYFRYEVEMRIYGFSIVDPSLIGDYYENHAVKLVDKLYKFNL